ncbi:cytochrome ubiquinol oxidase subunit I [Klebsiella pneumoniae]|nr:cytochrome ubiquinol oxidase subunit I [Klebsiella pneumoniae]
MFGLDAFHLARVQFAFTVSFHIIFPAITIGLASYLAVLEGLWLKTKNPVWRSLYHFWSKIFAVNFGMGVVSGLVMAYQFGTNWSGFSQFAGSITGPHRGPGDSDVLSGATTRIDAFGWNRVGPGLRTAPPWWRRACRIPSGSSPLTAGCRPAGFEIVDGGRARRPGGGDL